jgi:glycosyltransferase involved in cell wall biosynthesis
MILFFLILLYVCLCCRKKNIILNMTVIKPNDSGGIRNMHLLYKDLFVNSVNILIRPSKILMYVDLCYYILKYNPKIIISHSQKITHILKYIYTNKIFIIHIIHGNNYCKYIEKANCIFYLNNYQYDQLKTMKLEKISYYFPNFLKKEDCSTKIITTYNTNINIGIIGRFSIEKNFETVIKSMKYLENENINLYIAGDGSMKKIYKEIIHKFKLKNIFFMGWVDSSYFFNQIDIFIIPSLDEAFPLVIIEAMLSNKPIISSKTYGSIQILTEFENCLFVNDACNPEEYSEKIIYLKNNLEFVNRMCINNAVKYNNNYTLSAAKKRLEKILNVRN